MNKKINLLILLLFTVSFAFAQTTISGKVIDRDTKEPLIGVNLLAKGTSVGTTTDLDGNYVLELPKGALVLQVSYAGYNQKNVKLEGQTVLNIKLKSGKLLDEVVVIGYGAVKKSDVTGAVESLKPNDDEAAQFNNFQNLIQGRASGVYVQSNSNEIGAPNSIRIRGTNSLRGDNEPLYVVDGIIINSAAEDTRDPLSGGSSYLAPQNGLTGINSQDIESIEILKDASATAIYGSRGANGVIIITTKSGGKGNKYGAAQFNYQVTTRVGKATNLYEMLNTQEFVDFQNEWRTQNEWDPKFYTYPDGSIAQFVNDEDFMIANADSLPRLGAVDWYEDIFQNSFNQTHRLTVSGGKKKSNYYMAAGYGSYKGIIPRSGAKNGDFLLKFNQKLTNRLEISPRISGAFVRNDASKGTENLGSSNTSMIRHIILGSPLLNFQDNNEGTEDFSDVIDGPRGWIEDFEDLSNEFRGLASIKLDYKINKTFTYRVLLGGDFRTKKRQVWFGEGTNRGRITNGEAGISRLNRFRYNIDNTLLFNKKFNRNNRLNGTVGVVFDDTRLEQSSFSASNFANQDLRFDGISLGQSFQPLFFDKVQESLLSFLGRVNYTYKNRYLFTVSFRGDGTSKFADGNKFSFFPSAAFAWKLTEEDFMKNNNLFSEAKLRVGYGRTGSQAIRAYQTLSRFGPTANLLSDGGGGQVSAIVPLNLANPNLIWETTEQVNIGFDYGLKNDRFLGNIDLYYKKTSDLLQQLSIGPSAGFSTFVTNQGSLTNRGIEAGLTAFVLEGPVKWKLFGTISINRNKIVDLGLSPATFGTETYSAFLGRQVSGGTAFKVPANIYIEGRPAGLFWGYETNGIITDASVLENAPAVQGVAAQLGDILYIDRNGDGNINEDDLTVIGDPNPDFTYGFGSEFTYKNFNLNFFFNGVFGNEIANGNLAREDFAFTNITQNIRKEAYLNAWRPDATNATHPRLGYPLQGDFTDRMLESGSFLRLSYVTFGYTISTNSIKGIKAANIFISGQNLLLFTNYRGFDPEVNSFAFDASRQGVDWNSFPNQKSFMLGLNITFKKKNTQINSAIIVSPSF